MKSTRAYVFDADGVAVKPWGFAEVLKRDYNISVDDTRVFFSGPFQLCLSGRADLLRSVEPFLDKWCWPSSANDFIDLWLESDNRPSDEVLGVIRQLRRCDIHCYIASNQESIRAAYIRETMGFKSLFDALIFSCDLGVAKPDAGFYSSVETCISAGPRQIWYWDDSQEYVDGAKDAGWNAFLFESLESITNVV